MKTNNIPSKLIAFVLAVFSLSAIAQNGFGEIRGIVKSTGLEVIPFATIKILQGKLLVGGTQTDAKGHYSYKPLNPGTYEMMVMEAGHQTQPINKIVVIPNEATYVDVKMVVNELPGVEVVAPAMDYTKSGVDKNMYSMVTIDATDLLRHSGYERGDIKGALVSLSADVIQDGNGDIHVRGGRSDATAFFVDGVRTIGPTNVPGLAVENLTFFSGGVPAMYGDLTSGAVLVTTKSYFSGLRDKEMRSSAIREERARKEAQEKARIEEENRKKEIEAEKQKEKQSKTVTD